MDRGDVKIICSGTTSATRTIAGNVFDLLFKHNSQTLTVIENYFATGWDSAGSSAGYASFHYNLVRQIGTGGATQVAGLLMFGDCHDSYWLADDTHGNPHILLPQGGNLIDGTIFEYTGPNISDGGGAFILAAE